MVLLWSVRNFQTRACGAPTACIYLSIYLSIYPSIYLSLSCGETFLIFFFMFVFGGWGCSCPFKGLTRLFKPVFPSFARILAVRQRKNSEKPCNSSGFSLHFAEEARRRSSGSVLSLECSNPPPLQCRHEYALRKGKWGCTKHRRTPKREETGVDDFQSVPSPKTFFKTSDSELIFLGNCATTTEFLDNIILTFKI